MKALLVMSLPASWVAILVCGVVVYPPPAVAQVDQQRAQEYFKEAQALCERDGGRLWGVSICAPMVIADRQTQTFATSQPAPEGARPQALGLVNAPLKWGGATWGAYMWDDVANKTPRSRRELLLHELFHGVQPQLGLILPALPAGPAPARQDDGTFAGDGWTFKVSAGWVVREGARQGDYEVVRQQP